VRKTLTVLVALLIISALFVSSCKFLGNPVDGKEYRLGLIDEIKDFEKKLGYSETNNFRTYSDEIEVYHYYFYTPSTELPYSLDDPLLRSGSGTPFSINNDPKKYDIYFYANPALAGIDTPVTKSLVETPLFRFIHIIFHEDWHEQLDLPLGIEESSGEIISYTAAILFAEKKMSQNPKISETLREHLINRLRENNIYERYYQQLNTVYASFHAGMISEEETLRQKEKLLESMGDDLQRIWRGKSDQLNNAFIAFQMTYLRHLPLMYELLTATNFDLPKTIAILRAMPEQGTNFNNLEEIKALEKQLTDYLRDSLLETSQ